MKIDLTLTWSEWACWTFAGIFILRLLLIFTRTEIAIWEEKKGRNTPLSSAIEGGGVLIGLVRFILPLIVAWDNWRVALVMIVLDAAASLSARLLLKLWILLRTNPKINGYLGGLGGIAFSIAGIFGIVTFSTFTKSCSGFSSKDRMQEIKEARAKHPIPREFYGCKIGETTIDEFLNTMEECGLRVDYDSEDNTSTEHTIIRYITDGKVWRSKTMLFSFVDNYLASILFTTNIRSDYEYTRDSLQRVYKDFNTNTDKQSSSLYTDLVTGIIFEPEKVENTIALADIGVSKRIGSEVRKGQVNEKSSINPKYDPLREAYRKVKDCGYDVPSYHQFLTDMKDETNRNNLYNTLEKEGIDIGLSRDEFLSYKIEIR